METVGGVDFIVVVGEDISFDALFLVKARKSAFEVQVRHLELSALGDFARQ